jgi:hypothetical protein
LQRPAAERDGSVSEMSKRNITLSLPDDLLRQAKHLAVERGVSLSGLLAGFLEQLVVKDNAYQRSAKRMRARLKKGIDLGTGGQVTWSRDELYER